MRLLLFFFCTFSLHLVWAQPPKTKLQEIKILFLGDSLTAGYGVAKTDAYPKVVETLLKKKGYSVRSLNSGVSGSTSASATRRLKWQLKAQPQILVLALGANDGLRGVEPKATKKNLEEAISLAKKYGIKILLAGMKVPPNYGKSYVEKFEKLYTSLVSKHKLKHMPFLLKGVAGNKKFNLSDGIHPNENGHKKIAENLLPYLEPLIK